MRELFIYYKVHPDMAQAAHVSVVAMQRTLCASHELLEARLLKRSDATAASETWMEIYAPRPNDGSRPTLSIDDALEAEIVQAARALEPFIDGERHVERFDAVPP